MGLLDRLRVRRPAGPAASAGPEPEEEPGQDGLARPPMSDWAWRPPIWAVPLDPPRREGLEADAPILPGVTVHHDCPVADVTLTQAGAPGGRAVTLEAGRFEGSFLSLAIDLPEGAARSLRRSHIVAAACTVSLAREGTLYARLNIRQGPNIDQLLQRVEPPGGVEGPALMEFDLGFETINPRKLEAAWLDLILEAPAGNAARLTDLTLARRPRAEI
jgi:hypothetical protein